VDEPRLGGKMPLDTPDPSNADLVETLEDWCRSSRGDYVTRAGSTRHTCSFDDVEVTVDRTYDEIGRKFSLITVEDSLTSTTVRRLDHDSTAESPRDLDNHPSLAADFWVESDESYNPIAEIETSPDSFVVRDDLGQTTLSVDLY